MQDAPGFRRAMTRAKKGSVRRPSSNGFGQETFIQRVRSGDLHPTGSVRRPSSNRETLPNRETSSNREWLGLTAEQTENAEMGLKFSAVSWRLQSRTQWHWPWGRGTLSATQSFDLHFQDPFLSRKRDDNVTIHEGAEAVVLVTDQTAHQHW